MAHPDLHPALEPIAFLLGTWSGTGKGVYPTIDSFSYVEEISFGHVGKPFLAYSQRTKNAETGQPMHAESGYWRMVSPDNIEVVLAHPTGILESFVGNVSVGASETEATVIDLRSDQVTRSPTAVEVTETTRRFSIIGNSLTYDMSMAAVGQPLTHHLSAELTKE